MSNSFSEFIDALHVRTAPVLSALGFRKTGAGAYVRRRGEVLNVVWVQEHSQQMLCCVNLGIHYTFLPKLGSGAAVVGDEIELPECELRFRLVADNAATDQWWPFDAAAESELGGLIASRVPLVFEGYEVFGELRQISPAELKAELPPLLKPTTRVRASLLLARLHMHLENFEKAREFAELGIELSGMASGPRKAFKEILSRRAMKHD